MRCLARPRGALRREFMNIASRFASILLAWTCLVFPTFGQTPAPLPDFLLDLNQDGVIDSKDLLILIRKWGLEGIATPTPSRTSTNTPAPVPSTETFTPTLTPTLSETSTLTPTETPTDTTTPAPTETSTNIN